MIDVEYFALLREVSGKSTEKVELHSGDAGVSVFLRLQEKYGFPLSHKNVRLAVNDEFKDMDRPLASGEKIVFIPPVAGG